MYMHTHILSTVVRQKGYLIVAKGTPYLTTYAAINICSFWAKLNHAQVLHCEGSLYIVV